MMRNTDRKCAVNPMIMASAILFCLVLISTSMMSGLYARYTTMGYGMDDARVAVFDPESTVDVEQITVDFCQNNYGEFEVTTANNSEVAVRYDFIITFTEALPKGVKVTVDEKTSTSVSGNEYTFKDVGDLASGDTAGKANLLKFTVDAKDFVGEDAIESVKRDINFTLKVKITQID